MEDQVEGLVRTPRVAEDALHRVAPLAALVEGERQRQDLSTDVGLHGEVDAAQHPGRDDLAEEHRDGRHDHDQEGGEDELAEGVEYALEPRALLLRLLGSGLRGRCAGLLWEVAADAWDVLEDRTRSGHAAAVQLRGRQQHLVEHRLHQVGTRRARAGEHRTQQKRQQDQPDEGAGVAK